MARFDLFPAALGMTLVLSGGAQGQTAAQTPSQSLHLRALAATCANCHGTDGRAVQGADSIALRGKTRDQIVTEMIAFREGKKPATVMHQIAKGYTPEQIDQLAAYFAAQK